jgi:hypothetical protein
MLNALNGSYIKGFSDMNKKPFDPLLLLSDGYNDVNEYIQNNSHLKPIIEKTTKFLDGFYSDFTLELLSSVDYIVSKEKTFDKLIICEKLKEWNNRKIVLFSNLNYIDIALKQIKNMPQMF